VIPIDLPARRGVPIPPAYGGGGLSQFLPRMGLSLSEKGAVPIWWWRKGRCLFGGGERGGGC